MKKALIVIDMQVDFVTGALGTAEAQAIVPRVAARIREAALDPDYIYFACTLDTHEADYLQTQEGMRLPVMHCLRGTQGHALASAILEALPEDTARFEKNAFGSTALALAIPSDIEQVELIGLCTDICIINNAMLIKAQRPEIVLCVRADCCAGVTVARHQIALEAMHACQIDICSA